MYDSETAYPIMVRATFNGSTSEAAAEIRIVGSQPTVEIRAVEFTQGIQTMFREDGTPDDSVAMVERKDMIVRVYVDVDRDGFNDNEMEVTGEIVLPNNDRLQPINEVPDPANPYSDTRRILFVPCGEFSEDNRNHINETLNFLVPASYCWGSLDLDITIVGRWECEPLPSDHRIETITFRDVPALPIRVRRIKDKNDNVASVADCMENVLSAFTYLPSSLENVSVISGTLKTNKSYQSDWRLWRLSRQVSRDHDDESSIWVGLTPDSNRGIMAWPDWYTCISHAAYTEESDFSKTAHEICHCLGLGHVRNEGTEDCNFVGCESSSYEGPLDDVPFRARPNDIIPTPLARDLMGYESSSKRFLNPDFWNEVMDAIIEKF